MKIKKGVNIQGLDLRMRRVLIAADSIWRDLGQELVITSGMEGEHSAGSFHYYGLAVDLRTYYFSEVEKRTATLKLRDELGTLYTVVEHDTHIHVQFNA